MSNYTSHNIDATISSKIVIAAKRLGIEPDTLINQIIKEWIEKHKWISTSTEDILNEYEKALEGYSSSTKKTKIRIIKTFLGWCETNNITPTENVIEKFTSSTLNSYSTSYITHVKTTLKDFVEWFNKTWIK